MCRCWAFCLFALWASLARADVAAELSDEQLRFITANAEFTLLHEMGHLLISELQLPVLVQRQARRSDPVLRADELFGSVPVTCCKSIRPGANG